MTKKSKEMEKRVKFIRTHADKQVLDTVQINLYLTFYKLLREEMNRLTNPTDHT